MASSGCSPQGSRGSTRPGCPRPRSLRPGSASSPAAPQETPAPPSSCWWKTSGPQGGEALQVGESTFFITGGGSGLGAATARLFAENGAHVALADVDEEAGEQMASQIGSAAKFVRTDVTDEESVQDALDSVVEIFGSLNGAVNCAGIGPAAKVVGKKGVHDLGLFTKTVEINLVGTFNVIRLAAVRLAENEPGDG